ncbi:MAG: polysulfide reductase NrfD [Gemmataceae bacterium]|nr:polysulfide reductase NrfD [Gemmataceae bacterium]
MHAGGNPPGYAGREVTQPPNWHGLVTWDVFLNGLATGTFLVAAVAELVRPDLFAPLAVWAYPAALVLLLADLACLVLDLGDPLRFHHMLRVFKPLAPMSLGTWFLSAFALALTAVVGQAVAAALGWLPAESPVTRGLHAGLLVATLPLAFGSAAYKGVLFSTTAQPGWRDARWLGAYHTSGAFALGSAALLLGSMIQGADATDVLRTALVVSVTLNLVPLILLGRDLAPTLPVSRPGRYLLGAGALAVAPVAFLLVGGTASLVFGGLLVLCAGFGVRSIVVHLPHAVRAAG